MSLWAGPALAQDDDSEGAEGAATDDTSSDQPAEPDPTGAGGEGGAEMSGGGGGAAPAWGVATELNFVGNIGAARLLYGLGGNYLDLTVAFDLNNTSPEMGEGSTTWAFLVGAGYRLYRPLAGRIHPYIEPAVAFGYSNAEVQGQIGSPLTILASGALGFDFGLFDQFTLGAQVGAGLRFVTGDGGSVIDFGLFTSSINATFWW